MMNKLQAKVYLVFYEPLSPFIWTLLWCVWTESMRENVLEQFWHWNRPILSGSTIFHSILSIDPFVPEGLGQKLNTCHDISNFEKRELTCKDNLSLLCLGRLDGSVERILELG